MKNLSLDERKIVVGVDFGTTFSGVAWGDIHDVRPILQHEQTSPLLTYCDY